MALYDTASGISRTEHNCYATEKGKEVFAEIHEIIKGTDFEQRGERARELEEAYSLDFLGAGVSRVAYRATDHRLIEGGEECVVKIAQDRSVWQNKRETLNWILIEKADTWEVEQHYIPIIDFDRTAFRWVTMPFAGEGISYSESTKLQDRLEASLFGVSDAGMGNMGKLDGTLVMVDYGLSMERFLTKVGEMEEDFYFYDRSSVRDYQKSAIKPEEELEMFKQKLDNLFDWLDTVN
jgi:hypothetical protein